jgi:hypothetical protein
MEDVSASVVTGPEEVRIDGPGTVLLTRSCRVPAEQAPKMTECGMGSIALTIPVAWSDRPLVVHARLKEGPRGTLVPVDMESPPSDESSSPPSSK